MASEIRTSLSAISDIGANLWGGVDACVAFRLQGLYAEIPVLASADHDGRLGSVVASSLACLGQLIEGDVILVHGIDSALRGTDGQIGAKMGGGNL